MSAVIEARHPGVCPECGDTFTVGEDITKHPTGWGHVECEERWAPVPGFDDYQVSDQGRVRSKARRDRIGRAVGGKELRVRVVTGRHPTVTLYARGTRVKRTVHSIVLEAFVGPRLPGTEACHRDDDKSNNALTNLRWDSRSENTLDRVRNGTHHMSNRSKCPLGHELRSPNIPAWAIRRGHRACLACERARATARAQHRPFDPEAANQRYIDIMGGAA